MPFQQHHRGLRNAVAVVCCLAGLCLGGCVTSRTQVEKDLDLIVQQANDRYNAHAAWRVEGDHILVYFTGSDDEYKNMRNMDLP